jgi:hypothetical protein
MKDFKDLPTDELLIFVRRTGPKSTLATREILRRCVEGFPEDEPKEPTIKWSMDHSDVDNDIMLIADYKGTRLCMWSKQWPWLIRFNKYRLTRRLKAIHSELK